MTTPFTVPQKTESQAVGFLLELIQSQCGWVCYGLLGFSHTCGAMCEICLQVIPTCKDALRFYNTSSQGLNAEGLRSISLLASQDITVSLYKVRFCGDKPFEQGSLGAPGVFGVVADCGRALGSWVRFAPRVFRGHFDILKCQAQQNYSYRSQKSCYF